jgi:hypothetical protein
VQSTDYERAEDRGHGCRLEVPNLPIGARIDYLGYPTLWTVLFNWIPRLKYLRVPDYLASLLRLMGFQTIPHAYAMPHYGR